MAAEMQTCHSWYSRHECQRVFRSKFKLNLSLDMCHVYFDRGLNPRNGYFALRHGVRLVMRIHRDRRWQIKTKVKKVLTILKYYTGPRHSVVIFCSQHMQPLKVTEGSKFMEESTRLQDKHRDAQMWHRHLLVGGETAPRQWVFEHIKITDS